MTKCVLMLCVLAKPRELKNGGMSCTCMFGNRIDDHVTINKPLSGFTLYHQTYLDDCPVCNPKYLCSRGKQGVVQSKTQRQVNAMRAGAAAAALAALGAQLAAAWPIKHKVRVI